MEDGEVVCAEHERVDRVCDDGIEMGGRRCWPVWWARLQNQCGGPYNIN